VPVGCGVPVGAAELVGVGDTELVGVAFAVGVGVGVGVARGVGVGVVVSRDLVGAGLGEVECCTVEVLSAVPAAGGLTQR
jgi:hypothetical protein